MRWEKCILFFFHCLFWFNTCRPNLIRFVSLMLIERHLKPPAIFIFILHLSLPFSFLIYSICLCSHISEFFFYSQDVVWVEAGCYVLSCLFNIIIIYYNLHDFLGIDYVVCSQKTERLLCSVDTTCRALKCFVFCDFNSSTRQQLAFFEHEQLRVAQMFSR